MSAWTRTADPFYGKRVEHERDARMGPPEMRAQNAVVVRESFFSGTLGSAFDWKGYESPYAELTISLPIVLEPVQPEVKAMRACVRKYLNVSHAFVGAAIGYFRDCGIDAFNP